ncbi:hypothetical protein [Massilia sp. METH4]|uniref:hypothetical protein n=1 Tax=Massilia sp. METH4 TaxID=3123041 RepID=UPI0030CEACAC
MPPYIAALLLHGLLAAVDVLLNHELLVRLPHRPGAASEEWLHSLRELVFAVLFVGLAWFAWHGAFAWIIGALLLGEVLISACDVAVEGAIRELPATERVIHLFLFMNLGAIVVLLGDTLLAWQALPTALVPVEPGWWSWGLTALAVPALGWAIRDGLAARRLAPVRAA